MSYNKAQFASLIKRILTEYAGSFAGPSLCTAAAINLLLGTAAQESHFGTYLKQIKGPAMGAFQMEPATFEWLKGRYAKTFPMFKDCEAEDMEWDLMLAIVFARLRYRVVPEALPAADDLPALASYWKKYYNTEAGAGTVDEFIVNYTRFVEA